MIQAPINLHEQRSVHSSLEGCFLASRSPETSISTKQKGTHGILVCMAWRGGYARMEASSRVNGRWGLCENCWRMLQH
ncbi:50s ribosomal l34 [Gossypium arboreum]|uniref:50s ribosomal l34 n=1 Tax=Gossypium arboreum TaxID=29729 RepID=A0A0B0MGG8_GOSAR|nr:50s ribosomal l34 [Gossypium arboreum]